MTIISKEVEIQDKISAIYDKLTSQKESIYQESVQIQEQQDTPLSKHLRLGNLYKSDSVDVLQTGGRKLIEYDIYCYLVDIVTDYRDIEGYFPEYLDMIANLEQVMLKFAQQENYEVAAIIKYWLQNFINAL